MTLFLSVRTRDVGGPVRITPLLLEGDGDRPDALIPVRDADIAPMLASRDLVFVTHGFNVDRINGTVSLGALERYLALAPPALVIGVLWPGDAWIPVVDYPVEGGVAEEAGRRLAGFCTDHARAARSVSFISHSLGARLVLEAVRHIDAPTVETICLTAAAVSGDCLTAGYGDAARKAQRLAVLASRRDLVLALAYPIGDPFTWLLHDDHTPFQAALGHAGPSLPAPEKLSGPTQIPFLFGYDHSDYLPPGAPTALPPPAGTRWPAAADFMRRAALGQRQTWPPS